MSALPPIVPYLLGDPAQVSPADSVGAHDSGITATLYVDATLSDPPRPPAMRSLVEVSRPGGIAFQGTVRDIRELTDDYGQIHHWEVGLG